MTARRFDLQPTKWYSDAVWITTKQVAYRYGICSRRVLALAKERGVVGKKIGSMRVWTTEEVYLLQPRQNGAAGHLRSVLTKQLQQEIDDMKGKQ